MKKTLDVAIAVLMGSFAYVSVARNAAAQAAAPATEAPTMLGALIQMLPMLAVCYLIFYFMVIRPQEAKNKQRKTLLESLKRGDSVVTSGGLVGKVAGVEKEYVMLEIAPNVKIKVLQSHIARFEVDPQKAQAA